MYMKSCWQHPVSNLLLLGFWGSIVFGFGGHVVGFGLYLVWLWVWDSFSGFIFLDLIFFISKIYLNKDTAALYLQCTKVYVYNQIFLNFSLLNTYSSGCGCNYLCWFLWYWNLGTTFNLFQFSSQILSFSSISHRGNKKFRKLKLKPCTWFL